MSHMPTDQQPGVTTLAVQQAGVAIGAGPYRTLNFHTGATVVDAGGGVAQVDVTGGGGGTIPDGSITLAKLANLAQSTFIGRAAGAGTGVPQALTPAQMKTALAIAAGTDVSGLAAVALSGSASDLTTGTLSVALIADGSLALTKLANQAAATLVGRASGAGTGAPGALTAAQAKTLLAIATSDVSGLATIASTGAASDLVGSVSLAQLATQAQATFVGRAAAAGTGVPSALTAAQAKTALAIATGDVSGLAAIASSGSASDLSAGSIPSGRYASNTMVAATFAASTTQRVLGRNTAGAGAGEEVTASQLFDWVSISNGAILTRTAGAWAALANVTTDNGDLVLADNAAPVAPGAGVKLSSVSVAGRSMPAMLGAAGAQKALQTSLARTKIGRWNFGQGATIPGADGIAVPAVTGTATARSPASTNLAQSLRRMGAVSAASAASTAQIGATGNLSQFWRGNAAGLGGFFVVMTGLISDAVLVATANHFMGLIVSAVLTDVAPSTLTNLIGVGCDNGDTVLQLYAAGAAAQARVSLGANFPMNTINTDVYELALYTPPNAGSIKYLVSRLNTGDTASGTISNAANLPSTTTFLGLKYFRSNGGTASAVGIDAVSAYVETES